MTSKILIGMLNDGRRYNHFSYFCKFLSQSQYKDNFKIIILSNKQNSFFHDIPIKYNLDASFVETGGEYMDKIIKFLSYAKEYNYTYCFKVDNDIILPSHVFDFIYENINIIDKGILLPTLTTSIPSIYFLLEDYGNNEIKEKLFKMFKDFRYTNEWSIINNSLPEEYSYNNYVSFINNLKEPYCGNYKAIHPIRYDVESTRVWNMYVLENKSLFSNKDKQCYLFEDINKCYFMPQAFLMNISLLENVLDKSLAYDSYDEVTLNNLIKREEKQIFYIRNCFGLHIAHNGFMPNFLQYEEEFLSKFFE
jgi:hypothetical protein